MLSTYPTEDSFVGDVVAASFLVLVLDSEDFAVTVFFLSFLPVSMSPLSSFSVVDFDRFLVVASSRLLVILPLILLALFTA
jgi:hypothetical protein